MHIMNRYETKKCEQMIFILCIVIHLSSSRIVFLHQGILSRSSPGIQYLPHGFQRSSNESPLPGSAVLAVHGSLVLVPFACQRLIPQPNRFLFPVRFRLSAVRFYSFALVRVLHSHPHRLPTLSDLEISRLLSD